MDIFIISVVTSTVVAISYGLGFRTGKKDAIKQMRGYIRKQMRVNTILGHPVRELELMETYIEVLDL